MQNNKLSGKSLDNVEMRIDELKQLFPEAVNEGRLDYDTLMTLLGDEFDNEHEKYRFEWKGKQESLQLAQKRSSGTLRPDFASSKNWDTTKNVYIEGDNLEVLKLLQQGYLRQVKMIYIDPPYNTGNDFVYKDDFKDPIKGYKETTQQAMRANPETAGRYHSNWLSMMYPRLRIAKTLLKDDGVIFISIDDNEVHNLRKICDEVFGEENFVGTYLKQSKVGGGSDSKFLVKEHEYCLVYGKRIDDTDEMFIAHEKEYLKRYKESDERGLYFWDTFARPGLKNPIVYDIITPDGTVINNGWIHSKERFEKEYANGEVRIIKKDNGDWSVQFKQYLNESGKKPRSMTMDFGGSIDGKKDLSELFENEKIFSYPKSIKLVTTLMKTINTKNSIILDFFSGSATTAHAVMQLNAEDGGNRRFIMVQLDEKTDENSEAYKAGYKTIADIGRERIRRAGDKIISENPLLSKTLDTGFRSFKLDTSNLKKWDDNFEGMDKEQQGLTLLNRLENSLEELKSDRREIDVIYEIFLKYGVALTEELAQLEVCGKKFYTVGEDGYIFISLDKGITVETIEQLIKDYTPGTIIFADKCFETDDDITNTVLVLQKAEIEFRWI